MTGTLDQGALEACRHAALTSWSSVSACRSSLGRIEDPELLGLVDELARCSARLSAFVVARGAPMDADRETDLESVRGLLHEMLKASHDDPVLGVVEFQSTIFPVGEALQYLAFQRKSGTVRIRLEDGESVRLELEEGRLQYAVSDRNPPGDRLGEILVRDGSLTETQLTAVLASIPPGDGRLGQVLLTRKILGEQELLRALRTQVARLFERCLHSQPASIEFRSHGQEDRVGSLAMDLSEAVMTGMALCLEDDA